MRITTWSSENPNVKSKSPLPGAPNIEVVYDTFPETTTRAVRVGSLMEELMLSTLKLDEHDGLRGSSCRSVIPYVHGDDYCIIVCVLQASVELA
jgi:hypothetical protein